MKCFLKTAITLTMFIASTAASALDLIDPTYIYAEQPRNQINWMYIGFAPRMQDNQRVRVVLSKAGYTMRVAMSMTPHEVIDYPYYLVRRYQQVKNIKDNYGLKIYQQHRFDEYESRILAIQSELRTIRTDMHSQYTYGLNLLTRHFPANIFQIVENGVVTRVEGHFVYPITIHTSITHPRPDIYRPYILEERRSYYSKAPNHIFGGFPAFWLDPAGAGTGIHGPIRYSEPAEARRDGGVGRMRDFWAENNFLNPTANPIESLQPTYRWDLVRTNDSRGCFRAEPLELRHLLPSDPQKILDDNKQKLNTGRGPGLATSEIDYDSVTFTILADYDRLTVPGHFQNRIVNVDYYVTHPYQPADRSSWLRQRMLTSQERNSRSWETTLMTKMETEIHTFPYLDPSALEFEAADGGPANTVMGLLNQAH